eukprot:TRINITY_DN888_c0_g4_i2.p1 TRINITY_DN888_c0_g4~~TRINITY_DN888_c0_g4_i2.p1  ORF type:complete len:336 (+),score=18.43 TRINITY_DN888_c0_g4_i2:152-1159(+)
MAATNCTLSLNGRNSLVGPCTLGQLRASPGRANASVVDEQGVEQVTDDYPLQAGHVYTLLLPEQGRPSRNTIADLKELIRKQEPGITINEHVLERAIRQYATRVSLGLDDPTGAIAYNLYTEVNALPKTETEKEFLIQGWFLNGPYLPVILNEGLIVGYEGRIPHLLKALTKSELDGFKLMEGSGVLSPHIVLMRLLPQISSHIFAAMPLYPSTLEPLKKLSPKDATVLWEHMHHALQALHRHSLAHNDLKPSNICIDGDGNFILIDLGSVTRFGQRMQTTRAYIPGRIPTAVASASFDYWMLAAVIAERGCNLGGWGEGASNPSAESVLRRYHN